MAGANGFWTGTQGGVGSPKRQSRWLLIISEIPTWVCKSVSKPSFSIGESAHRYLNHTCYFPGRLEWNSIDVTLVDPVDPDISKAVLDLTRRAGYNYPKTEVEAQSLISKNGMIGALGTIKLQQLAPAHNANNLGTSKDQKNAISSEVVEEWSLHNAWIQDISFGSLSYDSDELLEITVKFRYDFAEAAFMNSSVDLFA